MKRQGDVQIVQVAAMPKDAIVKADRVLFHGEVTGHKHQIDVGELFETRNGELYLKVNKLTKIKHEEHKTTVLTKGIYFICQKRQYDAENGWERVQD